MESLEVRSPIPPSAIELHPDKWTQPFWDAGMNGELVCAQCVDCGEFRMPPGPFCPSCRSQSIAWVRLPGTATVFTFTTVRHAVLPEVESALPYVVTVVDLDGAPGCRLIVPVADSDGDEVRIGQQVRIVWERVGEVAVPLATRSEGRP